MKTKEGFWNRVQEILDQKNDPFKDTLVQDYLLEHPEHAHKLTSLCDRLAVLREAYTMVDETRSTKRHGLTWVMVLAAGTVAFLLWMFLDSYNNAPLERERHVVIQDQEPGEQTRSTILDFKYKITLTNTFEKSTMVRTQDGWSSTHSIVIPDKREIENGFICFASIVCKDHVQF